MKKVLLAMAMICLAVTGAFAQEEKGRMAVNIHGGMSTNAGAQGLAGVEFRVAVANQWRLAPQFNIGGGHGTKVFDITLDAHYVFNAANTRFAFYPIAGVGFAHYWEKYVGYKIKTNRIFLDLGMGAEYAINQNFGLIAEVKSQWMTDLSRGLFLVGCSYKF